MTFDQWLAKVNDALKKKIGLDYRFLPDQPYHDWFDQGLKPHHAANRIVKDILS
jgi:hypothetical protein